uniref:Uncharacterized protein n=1 Tax=Rhizophagus irregularis (strain DAOM 181602 / DAOM 197198 / MUCL 43194) TaxID=747089 RepID=U9U6V4_RHIID
MDLDVFWILVLKVMQMLEPHSLQLARRKNSRDTSSVASTTHQQLTDEEQLSAGVNKRDDTCLC